MSTYIPLIKRPHWIDLSDEHQEFRIKQLELSVQQACVERKEKQPLMIQGAFGIGKTNSLYYLFHYAWCRLKVPAFLISLEELIFHFEQFAQTKSSGKIDNTEIGPYLTSLLAHQLGILKNGDWGNVEELFFEDFQGGNLNEYLEGFTPLKLTTCDDAGHFEEQSFPVFSGQVIAEALHSGHKPLLLIDEFEAKFYRLKNLIDSAGGGYLKKLFDQIVKEPEKAGFYLVIGNGPASGYEIAKEKGDEGGESETGSNRRLDTQPVPFPTTRLLKNSFLKNEPKGYINFIWWLSRCRPGHVQKIYNTLKTYEKIEQLDYNDFINKDLFREPIDEGGEAVTYYKTVFFDHLPGKLEGPISKGLLSSFQPQKIPITEIREELRQCVDLFYCSTQPLSVERDLLPALKKDIFEAKLSPLKEEGRFTEVVWNDYLRKYFKYILDGISDENGLMAFGMINESQVDTTLAKTFVLPLLELTYDFISLYNDESLNKTKQNLDFIQELINWIGEALSHDTGVDTLLPETSELYKTTLLRKHEEAYLQLSLYAIRQSIEQPIGSPVLPYKSKKVESLLDELSGKEVFPLLYHSEDNLHLYFIPNLREPLLAPYLDQLEKYLNDIYVDKIHEDGNVLVRVLYFEDSASIKEFRKRLLYADEEFTVPKPVFTLQKFDVLPVTAYHLNFESQLMDYTDSVCKIGIIGFLKKDILSLYSHNDNALLELKEVISVIGSRDWMDNKEIIRTISHYQQVLFEGDNSAINTIHKKVQQQYAEKLASMVCDSDSFWSKLSDYAYLERIVKDDAEAYDSYTKNLALLYLFENMELSDPLTQLLSLCEEEYKFQVVKEDSERLVNYKNFASLLSKNKEALQLHKQEFDIQGRFLSSLKSFTHLLLRKNDVQGLTSFAAYLNKTADNHFIASYHSALGGYSKISFLTSTLYYLSLLESLDRNAMDQALDERVKQLEEEITQTRQTIIIKLGEVKSLLDETQVMSSYGEKLALITSGLSVIKRLLKENHSYSVYILINSLLAHYEQVADDSLGFSSQLDKCIQMVESQKSKVDAIQEEIDRRYQDSLSEKLLDFQYQIKRNKGYLWKRVFVKDNLKERQEYESLMGVSKNYYNPFQRPLIFEDKIVKFQTCMAAIYERKQPEFSRLLEEVKDIYQQAQETKQVAAFIEQLLNVTENAQS